MVSQAQRKTTILAQKAYQNQLPFKILRYKGAAVCLSDLRYSQTFSVPAKEQLPHAVGA
jgi:hypothetical protein